MPTASRKVNIYPKRLLSLTAIRDNFLEFLTDEIDEVTSAIFQGTSGVLDADEIEIVAGASNDRFTLDLTNASRVVVGTGQIIDLSLITGTGITSDIYFEDDGSSVYYVGIKFAEVQDGIEINPRTADPEYPSLKQTYGEVATPDLVTDNTTYIRIRINSITESGVDHTGRTVRVWLVDPVSGVESVAFFDGTSAYSAPNNYVDIPYSGGDGPLGQDTSSNPPSTTASDYRVFIEGASWKKNTDLRTDSDYAFIGLITSTGGVPVFDMSDQVPIFINTLDRAYDGAAGSGSGRLIFVDNEAVELRSRSGGNDELYAAFRIDRKGGTEDAGVCAQFVADQSDGKEGCAFHLVPLVHSTAGLVVDNPCTTTNPDIVTRTGGVNWVNSKVRSRADFAWLQGFATSDGLYAISAITATTLQLVNIDGSSISLTGSETGNVTVVRVVQGTGVPLYGSIPQPNVSSRGPNAFTGLNEDTSPPALAAASFYGYESDAAHFWDTETNPVTQTKRGRVTKRGQGEFQGFAVLTNPLAFSGGETELIDHVAVPTQDPPSAISSGRAGRVLNQRQKEIERLELLGRRATTHHFKDDFNYRSTAISWSAPGLYYDTAGSGVTPGFATGIITDPGGWGTISTDSTSPAAGQNAELRGEHTFRVIKTGPVDEAVLCMYAKIRLDDIAHDPVIRIGFRDTGGLDTIWWECSVGGAIAWRLQSDDGAGGTSTESSAVTPTANANIMLWIVADPFANSGAGYIGGRIEQVGTGFVQLTGVAFPSAAGQFLNLLGLFAFVETNDGDISALHIDEWEAWEDNFLRSGDAA